MRHIPIFVDSSGRRRRVFTMIAAAAGVLMATAAVILVAGFVGSPGHLPGLPELQPGQQEVAKLPQPQPTAPDGPVGQPSRPGTSTAPAPSTLDTRGNNGNGNGNSNRPDHPRPSRSK